MRPSFTERSNQLTTDFDAIRISLASPDKILSWSHGEVTKPETINYRTFKPERDGLFCAKIFGPVTDWECLCGKFKRMKHRGVVCVEVTQARVRRERLGHITLATPVSHVWFFKGLPSRIGHLLDISLRDLERVLYFEAYVVIDKGETDLERGRLLTDQEYRDAREKGGHRFRAQMGAEAIKELLKGVDVEGQARRQRDLMITGFELTKESLRYMAILAEESEPDEEELAEVYTRAFRMSDEHRAVHAWLRNTCYKWQARLAQARKTKSDDEKALRLEAGKDLTRTLTEVCREAGLPTSHVGTVADLALVEILHAVLGDAPVGAAHVGVAQQLAHAVDGAAGLRVDLRGGGVVPEHAHALDAPAGVVVGLVAGAQSAVVLARPVEAAVVADVDRAVGADGRAVRAAAQLGDHAGAAVGRDPRERATGDLHQHDRAVVHGDRAFRELQPRGDLANAHSCLPPCSASEQRRRTGSARTRREP